ncbi:Holliday junction branch migration protein RuvA [Candidatus Nitrosacidococcus tergens]|uniref:Holliday junction branch migration complex subunit RuvA n=1 Tax=Candidatus Nitrosacidococcus tergens TaxID=553981 RepID=A0A7G1QBJ2_9GAMM|nr:Holliday junction branch migration protein RuvA [Candidatus Nitrosacidococcus tergens]CAB1277459.1 component of RuvABC resolvasome, regulatory subunit [Candidatus Nitrosacidococcus tergens]
MISRLHGILLERKIPFLLLDVHGVGYEVEVPVSIFASLPDTGSEVTLHTHLVVRENAYLLYGFINQKELSLFRHLIKVNSVGAKLALAILSGIDAATFIQCIHEKDITRLIKLPGIGKKTAERLILEMSDKLSSSVEGSNLIYSTQGNVNSVITDAVQALINLGYKPKESFEIIRQIDTAELTTPEIIRQALQIIGRS